MRYPIARNNYLIHEESKQYVYIGGVENYDVWVRDRKNTSSSLWDVILMTEGSNWRGFDVSIGRGADLYNAQQRALVNAIDELSAQSDDAWLRVVSMLKCFAPHLFHKKRIHKDFLQENTDG